MNDLGLRQPPNCTARSREAALRMGADVGYPLVVKPDAQGSSLGVSIVNRPDELPHALIRCFRYDAFGILEPGTVVACL